MSVLSTEQRARVVSALVDGMSIRATQRITDVEKKTIGRLGLAVGEGCARFHDRVMRGLRCSMLQLDEIWAFIHTKQGHLMQHSEGEHGDAWTFIALDCTRKVIVSYLTGKRSANNAKEFVKDLRARVVGRPLISADGFKPYSDAIREAFKGEADFGQLVKQYDGDETNLDRGGHYKGATSVAVMGTPNLRDVHTSYVERANLTLRMGQRRFTRKTNAFSKDVRHHDAAIALHVAHYNFARVHETLRVTPAMAMELTDHVWSIGELIDAALSEPATDPAPTLAPVPPQGPVQLPLPGMPALRVIRGGKG